MTYASFLSVVASTLMSLFFWSALFGGGFGRSRNSSAGSYIMIAYLVTILVWVISQVLIAALSRYREYAADRGAAILTSRPRDLRERAPAHRRLHHPPATERPAPRRDAQRVLHHARHRRRLRQLLLDTPADGPPGRAPARTRADGDADGVVRCASFSHASPPADGARLTRRWPVPRSRSSRCSTPSRPARPACSSARVRNKTLSRLKRSWNAHWRT